MTLDTLLHQADRQTRALLREAERRFRIRCPLGAIRFDLKGKSAGMVVFPPGKAPTIRYNSTLLQRNREGFLSQTLPHEVAHLVARRLHGGNIRPHGPEWRAIMRIFGADPVRCHNFKLEERETRKLRRFPYRCGCREHQLTSIRHNRILKGQTYICRSCGEALRLVSP